MNTGLLRSAVPAPAPMASRGQASASAGASTAAATPGAASSFASIMRDTLDARGATADRAARHEPATDAAPDRPATRGVNQDSAETPALLEQGAGQAVSGGLSLTEFAAAGTVPLVDPATRAEADESAPPVESEGENPVPAIAADLILPVVAQPADTGVVAATPTAEPSMTPSSDTATTGAAVGVPVAVAGAGAGAGEGAALRAAGAPTATAATASREASLEADGSLGESAPLAPRAATVQTATPNGTAGTSPVGNGTAGSPVGTSPTALAGLVPGAAAVFGAAMAFAAARTDSGAPTAPAEESAPAPATVAAPAGAILTAVPTAAPTVAAAATAAPAPAPPTPAAPLASQVARPLFSLAGAANGEHVITISVSPDNLGPVTVRAHVNGDAIRVELFAPTDLARDALRAILPDLRRDLSGGGLNARLDLSGNGSPAGSSADPSAERQGGRNQPDARPGRSQITGIADAEHSFRAPVFGNAHTIDILA